MNLAFYLQSFFNTQLAETSKSIAIIGGFIIIIGIGLWIWSLIHCIQNKQLSDSNRTIGIVLIVALGVIGSFIYLLLPRDTRRRGRTNNSSGMKVIKKKSQNDRNQF